MESILLLWAQSFSCIHTLFSKHIPVGGSSKPENLRSITLKNAPSIVIQWDPPVYSGGDGIIIQKYRIRIREVDYIEEEHGTKPSHTIDGTNMMFNRIYMVEVSAINTCEVESIPANISVTIEATGKRISYYAFVIYMK